MTSEQLVTIILALIATIVPTITVLVTWRQSKGKIAEVHQVVNSRLDGALSSIDALKTEIRRLNRVPGATTPDPELENVGSHVTLSEHGAVGVVRVSPPVPASLVKAIPHVDEGVPEQAPTAGAFDEKTPSGREKITLNDFGSHGAPRISPPPPAPPQLPPKKT